MLDDMKIRSLVRMISAILHANHSNHSLRYVAPLVLLPGLALAADQAPTPAPAPMADEVGQMRDRLDRLQSQVDELQRQQQQASPQSADATLEERVSHLEASPLADSSVTMLGSGGITVAEHKAVGRTVEAEVDLMALASFRDDALFVGELNASQDSVGLGQAYVAYTALPQLVVELGLSPLPFAAYSEQLAPPWINRLASAPPPPYADDYGVFAGDQSDVGLQLRGDYHLGAAIRANYHVFIADGPSYANPDDPDHPDDRLAFGGSHPANHVLPTFGLRLGFLPTPTSELGLSAMAGGIHNNESFDPTIDTDAKRSFFAGAIDAKYRVLNVQLTGEWLYTDYQDIAGARRHAQGMYLQASRLIRVSAPTLRGVEPVLRVGRVQRDTVEAGYQDVNELAGGLNYWFNWHLRASLIGELHNVHALDQIIFNTTYVF